MLGGCASCAHKKMVVGHKHALIRAGQIAFGTVNTGFTAGQTYNATATLDTAEVPTQSPTQHTLTSLQDDWQYPAGAYSFEALSCKYGW